jgi:biotin carboxylase
MFDEETEKLAEELGAEVWFPKAALRNRVDNKIETVRIGNKAGVPSAPNALSVIDSWEQLQKVASDAGLGDDLVLHAAFGDSVHTTLFIKTEADYRKHEKEIVGQGEI